jgi:uncharacterized protein
MFTEIINMLLGRPSRTETLGLSPVGVAVIETDGSIEQTDNLKSAYQGATGTGLHVRSDSFDRALTLPGVIARQIGERALCDICTECPIYRVCGAGLYAHRYRAENGFDNPSVYCADLQRLIYHVRRVAQAQVDDFRRKQ